MLLAGVDGDCVLVGAFTLSELLCVGAVRLELFLEFEELFWIFVFVWLRRLSFAGVEPTLGDCLSLVRLLELDSVLGRKLPLPELLPELR